MRISLNATSPFTQDELPVCPQLVLAAAAHAASQAIVQHVGCVVHTSAQQTESEQ